MPMASSFTTRLGSTVIHHRRAVQPLVFPDSEDEELRVPEGKLHVMLEHALFAMLRTLAGVHTIGCDQVVYFNAPQPKRRCAPDVFVKLGAPDSIPYANA